MIQKVINIHPSEFFHLLTHYMILVLILTTTNLTKNNR